MLVYVIRLDVTKRYKQHKLSFLVKNQYSYTNCHIIDTSVTLLVFNPCDVFQLSMGTADCFFMWTEHPNPNIYGHVLISAMDPYNSYLSLMV